MTVPVTTTTAPIWRWRLTVPADLIASHGSAEVAYRLRRYQPHYRTLAALAAGSSRSLTFARHSQAVACAARLAQL